MIFFDAVPCFVRQKDPLSVCPYLERRKGPIVSHVLAWQFAISLTGQNDFSTPRLDLQCSLDYYTTPYAGASTKQKMSLHSPVPPPVRPQGEAATTETDR